MDSKTVKVNGVVLNEPYISVPANPVANVWKVPADNYFVMGDNRQYSDDSRDWGYVPKGFIVGKAVLIYWPMNDWQFLNTYPQVYDRIKAPH
jgi:signal peptidase I